MNDDKIIISFSKIYLMDGKSKRVAIFEIQGEVGADNSYDIGLSIKAYIAEGYHIVIDLNKVAFISSAGIGLLVGAYKKALKKNQSLVIVNPSDAVKSLLKMTTKNLFTIKNSKHEAFVQFASTPQKKQVEILKGSS